MSSTSLRRLTAESTSKLQLLSFLLFMANKIGLVSTINTWPPEHLKTRAARRRLIRHSAEFYVSRCRYLYLEDGAHFTNVNCYLFNRCVSDEVSHTYSHQRYPDVFCNNSQPRVWLRAVRLYMLLIDAAYSECVLSIAHNA